jgi:hypothetical protein
MKRLLTLLCALCVLCGSISHAAPNILVILADDAGYTDFRFQGGGINWDFASSIWSESENPHCSPSATPSHFIVPL